MVCANLTVRPKQLYVRFQNRHKRDGLTLTVRPKQLDLRLTRNLTVRPKQLFRLTRNLTVRPKQLYLRLTRTLTVAKTALRSFPKPPQTRGLL